MRGKEMCLVMVSVGKREHQECGAGKREDYRNI